MSAAAATAPGAPPAKKERKKLLFLAIAVVLLLAIAGAAAIFLLKPKSIDADGDDATTASGKVDLKNPPTFLPLDPFVVNLADRDTDRYAQVGVTFEIADAHFADEVKGYMPAIRNGILLILSHKTSKDLLDRSGKEKLADEIQRESARTLGLKVDERDAADTPADDEDAKPKSKKKKSGAGASNPIRRVHFSNFIVQ